ncbi:TetR/AcrR family transcriptional regulator [Bradyrhizobium australafricanum]|uniref:TetR/AcrR family transcriptional regulator n=1 Tax=Bradyrhizobium australafricanum TaxID=2821406 RepID=UPI001CE350DF|nr:TetR family transcriptional regulator [Bradyrhizobium australafricanum]MCA6100546.1 CerR family C-terminal domain-containing protein [Bradyrhizobium australafricanum]
MRVVSPQRDQEIKDRIVAAAEHVFAEMGMEKATLRDITSRAKVNVAAVSYYFGSKSDLVHSVFDQLSTRLNERRIRDLDECLESAKQAGKSPDLRAILEIFIRPYLDGKSGRLFARMILQHRLAPSQVTQTIISAHFDPMARRFIRAITEACPHVDAKFFFWRYVFMIGSVVYTVADTGILDRTAHLSGGKVRARSAADLAGAMLDFCVAGMANDPDAADFHPEARADRSSKRRQS